LSYQSELRQLQERLERQKAEHHLRLQEHERQVAGAARERANREHLLAQIRSRKELQQAALAALQQAAAELAHTLQALTRRAGSESHRPAAPVCGGQRLAYLSG
jgi:septal ring factor EnvC (AmiA/AmiB activator)